MTRQVLSPLVAAAVIAAAVIAAASPAASQEAAPTAGSRVADHLRGMERTAARVQRLLGNVRASGDRVRSVCVDGRLTEIHALLRLALERRQRLHRAVEAGDRIAVEREQALVGKLANDVRRLERQAFACVDPEPSVAAERTRVIATIEPWVPHVDVSELPSPLPSARMRP